VLTHGFNNRLLRMELRRSLWCLSHWRLATESTPFMPGACLNSWQTDACEWSIGYIWSSSDWIERGLFITLALMLSCTLFIFIRFSCRYYSARRESRAFVPDSWRAVDRYQRTVVADLSRGLRTLKAIASAAPFLGLAGTSYWVLGGLFFAIPDRQPGSSTSSKQELHHRSSRLQLQFSWLFQPYLPTTSSARASTASSGNSQA